MVNKSHSPEQIINKLREAEILLNQGATVITSQCPIGDWHPNIGDPILADAICDRLLHNAYKVELRGDSMRKNKGEPTATSLATNQKNEKGGNLADDIKLS